ncbi:MAG: hypothetical protein HY293_21795 [Planctomycetes bacterium]|nr:hypothetical protein [Planctomycetota bacterium]
MIKHELLRRLAPALFALAAAGCGSPETGLKRTMPMEGVVQLPPPKAKQVATYRCSINLATGHPEVKEDKRTGRDEEKAWMNLSPKFKQGDKGYEVVIEQSEKNAKGAIEWALVSVLETEAATGKLLRKLPVQDFWGAHDRQTPRALMMKDGRFQFFVQFWPAD